MIPLGGVERDLRARFQRGGTPRFTIALGRWATDTACAFSQADFRFWMTEFRRDQLARSRRFAEVGCLQATGEGTMARVSSFDLL